MATNETPFTTTPIAFTAVVAVASTDIPDNSSAAMIPAVFQVVVHVAIASVDPAATTGLDIIPSGAVWRSYCWSYSYVTNLDHTSASCRNKKTGQCDTITGTNSSNGKHYMYSPNMNK